MGARSYGQYCGLARALDLVGERWTLLIVRNLALGPKRFGELLDSLEGLGTSVLSERLQTLERIGVLERVAAPLPERGTRYRLTRHGQDLARSLAPLTAWGATHLGPAASEDFRPDWLEFTLRSSFRAEGAAGLRDCYELRVGPRAVVWLAVEDGRLAVLAQPPRQPDFVVEADVATLAQLGAGLLQPDEAIASGRARFAGDPEAGRRMLALFGSQDPASSAV